MKDISVILPIYNGANLLNNCIQRLILAGDRILEILIIDDGSTDETLSIAQGISQEFHNISVIHTENHGIYMARRKGIELARGNYIAFIDADDYFQENALDLLANLVEQHDADIAIGGIVKTNTYDYQDKNAAAPNIRAYSSDEIWQRAMRWKTQEFISYAWNKLYKKAVLSDLVIADHICQGEDVLLTCQAFLKADKIVETTQNVYCYYQNPDSITHVPFNKHDLELISVWDEICLLMKNQNENLYYMAQTNRWRTDFTLTCRLILANDKSIEKEFSSDLQEWRDSLKVHYKELIKARNMPFNRYVVLVCLRFAFLPTKLFMQAVQKLWKIR